MEFADIVRATFDARVRGTMGGLSETISELAQRARGSPTSHQIALAAEQRLAFSRGLLSDKYSAPHLSQLKSRGYQFGVVTDCSAETPLSWASSWLQDVVSVIAFSCELGVRKPDPEMYLSVTRRLRVQPEECLYIGDGDSNELNGARELGMATTMLVDPNLLDEDCLVGVNDWDGAVLNSLEELISYVIE